MQASAAPGLGSPSNSTSYEQSEASCIVHLCCLSYLGYLLYLCYIAYLCHLLCLFHLFYLLYLHFDIAACNLHDRETYDLIREHGALSAWCVGHAEKDLTVPTDLISIERAAICAAHPATLLMMGPHAFKRWPQTVQQCPPPCCNPCGLPEEEHTVRSNLILSNLCSSVI